MLSATAAEACPPYGLLVGVASGATWRTGTIAVGEGVSVLEGMGVTLGVSVSVGVLDGGSVWLGVSVAVNVAEGVNVSLGVYVCEGVSVSV